MPETSHDSLDAKQTITLDSLTNYRSTKTVETGTGMDFRTDFTLGDEVTRGTIVGYGTGPDGQTYYQIMREVERDGRKTIARRLVPQSNLDAAQRELDRRDVEAHSPNSQGVVRGAVETADAIDKAREALTAEAEKVRDGLGHEAVAVYIEPENYRTIGPDRLRALRQQEIDQWAPQPGQATAGEIPTPTARKVIQAEDLPWLQR